MFRGYMPALTVAVFGIGLGIGVSWSRGLIPLSLSPAKTGSLSPELTQREPLPPPNDVAGGRSVKPVDEPIQDDPAVFEQQTEPDIDASIAVVSRSAIETTRSRVIPAAQTAESTEDAESEITVSERYEEEEKPQQREPIRLREQSSAERRLSSKTPVEVSSHANSLPEMVVGTEEVNGEAPSPRPSPQGRGERQDKQNRANKKVTPAKHQDPTENSNELRKDEAPSPQELLADADAKLEAGEILPAHKILSKIYWNHKEFRPQIQDKIDNNAKAIFFQSQPHFVEPYVIQSGDRLEAIAKKYQLSWEYLAKLNRTEPRRIQIGQKLKVIKGPFSAVVQLHDFTLAIHLQGYYVKQYSVCTGKNGSSPVGKFSVLNKVENPPYTGPDGKVIAADDPSNPLGERWIDLGDSYGIHGTIDPDSIGRAESRGCIRMGDREIVEVYNFLVKGSEVVIRK